MYVLSVFRIISSFISVEFSCIFEFFSIVTISSSETLIMYTMTFLFHFFFYIFVFDFLNSILYGFSPSCLL